MLSESGPLGSEQTIQARNPATGQGARSGIFILVEQKPGPGAVQISEFRPRGHAAGPALVLELQERLPEGSLWRVAWRAGQYSLQKLVAPPMQSAFHASAVLSDVLFEMPQLRQLLGQKQLSLLLDRLAQVYTEAGSAFSKLPFLAALNALATRYPQLLFSGHLEEPRAPSLALLRMCFAMQSDIFSLVDKNQFERFARIYVRDEEDERSDFESIGGEEELLGLVNFLAKRSSIGRRYWQAGSLASGDRRVAVLRVLLDRDGDAVSRISLEFPDSAGWRVFSWVEPARGSLSLQDATPALPRKVIVQIEELLKPFGFSELVRGTARYQKVDLNG